MSELEKSFRELSKTENVFLFVPNLIGYGRIFLALLRFGEKSEAARNTFKTQNLQSLPIDAVVKIIVLSLEISEW